VRKDSQRVEKDKKKENSKNIQLPW